MTAARRQSTRLLGTANRVSHTLPPARNQSILIKGSDIGGLLRQLTGGESPQEKDEQRAGLQGESGGTNVLVNKESQGDESAQKEPEIESEDSDKLEEEASVQELDENGLPILDEKRLAKLGKDVSRMKQKRQ